MPPRDRPAVRVRVVDPAERPITGATVVATSAGPATLLPFDPFWHVYTNRSLTPGTYLLRVSAAGVETQQRTIAVTPDDGALETFVLGDATLPYYYQGHVKIPYRLHVMVAVAMRHGSGAAIADIRVLPQTHGLAAAPFPEPPVSDRVHDQRVYVFSIPGDDRNVARRFELLARADPRVRAAGVVVRFDGRSVAYLTNEIVLKLRPGASMPPLLAQLGLDRRRTIPYVPNCFVVASDTESSLDVNDKCLRLAADASVMWAEPNLFSSIVFQSNDPLYPYQTHHPLIRTEQAWTSSHRQGQNIRIAVVDGGCETTHEDLAANIETTFNFDAMTANLDPDPHGTAATGTAAARVDNAIGGAGVAGLARIIAVQMMSDTHVAYSDMFKWCAGLSIASTVAGFPADLVQGADVISNSWQATGVSAGALSSTPGMGGTMADAFYAVTHWGRNSLGSVIVFAAGNDTDDVAIKSPWAAYPTNLAIGASTAVNPEEHVFNSNYGAELDVCAPGGTPPGTALGHMVLTTTYVPTVPPTLYGDFGETSCACPQAAGVAALILCTNPSLTPPMVRQILVKTAVKITDPANGGLMANPSSLGPGAYVGTGWSRFSSWYGYGRIDAYAAVQAARFYH
jgi:subtilase family protein